MGARNLVKNQEHLLDKWKDLLKVKNKICGFFKF